MVFDRVRRLGRQVSHIVRAFSVAVATAAIVAVPAGGASAKNKYAAMVVDANTGKTLFSRYADAPRYPASLTKIMTLYIVFEEMRAGRIGKSTRFKVSKKASRQPPSKLGLKPGSTIGVNDAIRALVTKSANDVAMVVAENISGSESRFARRMTSTARRLGMRRTTFRNPHGLPNQAQRTTARDMAILGRAIQQHFPQRYKYFATRKFVYRGRHYRNHNKLLGRVKGVDGIKTGYTRASGFNLVSSVRSRGRHIVAVVMGGKTGRSRNAHMRKLIAAYLPKASKSRLNKGAMIAGNMAPNRVASARRRNLPKPRAKPSVPIVTASIPPARTTDQDAPRMVKTQTISIGAHNAPSEPAPTTTPASAPAKVAPAKQKATQSRSGWQIQIAALPSKSEATALMTRARRKHESLLARRDAYTMRIDKGGNTLYRARFAGFSSKKAAKSACSSLKKDKFACFAVFE